LGQEKGTKALSWEKSSSCLERVAPSKRKGQARPSRGFFNLRLNLFARQKKEFLEWGGEWWGMGSGAGNVLTRRGVKKSSGWEKNKERGLRSKIWGEVGGAISGSHTHLGPVGGRQGGELRANALPLKGYSEK